MNVALIFAGGCGSRMGTTMPKQFLEINGKAVLAHTLSLFQSHPQVDGIWLVVASDQLERARELAAECSISKLMGVAIGGDSAQASIYNGLVALRAVCEPDTIVLIHDGVRPYVERQVIAANIDAVRKHGNAVTFTPCHETVAISKDGKMIDDMPYRRESYVIQAPQSFRLGDILAAHERIRARPEGYADMVDQATICHALGIPVHLMPGNNGNIKVTTQEDVRMLSALLACCKENENDGRRTHGMSARRDAQEHAF